MLIATQRSSSHCTITIGSAGKKARDCAWFGDELGQKVRCSRSYDDQKLDDDEYIEKVFGSEVCSE